MSAWTEPSRIIWALIGGMCFLLVAAANWASSQIQDHEGRIAITESQYSSIKSSLEDIQRRLDRIERKLDNP